MPNPMKKLVRPRVHGQRTGFVWIRDFDVGMLTSLGGVRPSDPRAGDHYRVSLPKLPLEERDVPIYLVNPEQTLVDYVLPRFVIRRSSWEPALERWHPITEEYRIPGPTSTPITIQNPAGPTSIGPSQGTIDGHTKYEGKVQAWPYDITYEIEVWARAENFAQVMLFHVLRRFQPLGSFMSLVDSLGDTRTYDAFAEGGPVKIDEIVGMTDRTIAYNYTVRVTGEIDLVDEVEAPAARVFNVSSELLPSNPDGVEC